ncbi:MAG TPA: AAA family ATPase [Streptosporangiaceae bacterium]|nr:AAA family ATPase [Streptosporangiaceae bacterium]
MTRPDQLKVPAPTGQPACDALDDFMVEAAAWDPAVEEVWLGDRELAGAARRLLDERLLTEPAMVYRLVALLAEAGVLAAGELAELAARALAALAAGPGEGQPGPAGPRPRTPLTPAGREHDYARGRDMAAQRPDGVGIVCVTGPAGVGKTHLARAIAAAATPAGQATRLEVSLSTPAPWMAGGLQAKAPYDALRELLIQLGVREAEVPDSMAGRRARYAKELAGRRPAVLIDGALDASQVLPLLPPTRGSVVITSRSRLSGLTGWNAGQLPLSRMTEAGSQRLAREVFETLGIAPPERIITAIAERGEGLPGRIILLCRWMAVTARAEGLDVGTLAGRLDVTADAAGFPRLLDEDQQAVLRVLGLLPLSGADLTAVRLGTDLTVDRAQAALDRLTRLGLITEVVPGRVWVTTSLAIAGGEPAAGAEPTSAGQVGEAEYQRVLSVYARRAENLRDMLTGARPESLSSLRSWARDRWQAERPGVRALLSAAAGSRHPGLACPLAAAWADVTAQIEGPGSGHREAEEAVRSVLRIASDAGDGRLAAWAATWLEREVTLRDMAGPEPAASSVPEGPPEPSSPLEAALASEVTPINGPVLFGAAGARG